MKQVRRHSVFQMAVIILITCVIAIVFRIDAEANYAEGDKFLRMGNYQQAELYFSKCSLYLDGAEKLNQVQEYMRAKELYDGGELNEAREIFFRLGDFEESSDYLSLIDSAIAKNRKEQRYNEACKYMLQENYSKAYDIFNALGDYEDSEALANECKEKWRQSNNKILSAGTRSSAGITPDNAVKFTTGDAFWGKTNIQRWNDIVSISTCGEIVIGLKRDGTVVTTTKQEIEQYDSCVETNDWEDIIAVSAGDQYVVGLKSDGHVVAESMLEPDGYGETNVSDWENIIAIDTAWQLTAGLDREGNVHISGYCADQLQAEIEDSKSAKDKNKRWADIVSISIGGSGVRFRGKGHIVGLTKNGHVVAVGDNDYGQCDVSMWENEKIIAISAGDYHTVALTSDGRVLTTQSKDCHIDNVDFSDSVDQIAEWRDIIAVSAGYGFTLGLRSDGTVVSAGNKNNGQADVQEWSIKS